MVKLWYVDYRDGVFPGGGGGGGKRQFLISQSSAQNVVIGRAVSGVAPNAFPTQRRIVTIPYYSTMSTVVHSSNTPTGVFGCLGRALVTAATQAQLDLLPT